jgi:hypothetical protein
MTDESAGLYNDVTILVLLRKSAVFVPALYATSLQNVQVAHTYYAMPKQLAPIQVSIDKNKFSSALSAAGSSGSVQARWFGKGKFLAKLAAWFLPWRTLWAWFPTASFVRALIQTMPKIHIAHLAGGRCVFPLLGIPKPLWIFSVGLYAPALRMQLPRPQTENAVVPTTSNYIG